MSKQMCYPCIDLRGAVCETKAMANRTRGIGLSTPRGGSAFGFGSSVEPRGGSRWLLLSALLAALGCSSGGSDPGQGHGSGGLVCPRCSVAGGETSDFGSIQSPSPCEESEQATPIDEPTARALGFGDTLDSLTRSFTTSLRWTPDTIMLPEGGPAQGFSSPTSITVETSVASIQHLVPTLAGCDDRIQVGLHTALSTADGAITITGDTPNKLVRGSTNQTFGRLDLSGARGSLQLEPPTWPDLVGYLSLPMSFTPEEVRGFVYVELVQAGTVDSDNRASYEPLHGQFPNDDCGVYQRVLSASDPTATPDGRSALSLDTDLSALLPNGRNAVWLDGQETSVTATLGTPSSLCQGSAGLSYVSIPLAVASDDGRLNVKGPSIGSVAFDATGKPTSAGFERYGTSPPETFAQDSGISGVDVSGYTTLEWDVAVVLIDPDPSVVGGSVVVTGWRTDNSNSQIETLTWH